MAEGVVFFSPLVMAAGPAAGEGFDRLLVVGFLGAYTTFSTFEYETGTLVKDGEWLTALLNVILSVLVGFMALKLGEVFAKSL